VAVTPSAFPRSSPEPRRSNGDRELAAGDGDATEVDDMDGDDEGEGWELVGSWLQ
jgi:hypothetical protein